jgi:hypothetical protein
MEQSSPSQMGNLIDLFEHHTELVAKASYEVQSSVPVKVFELFVKALVTGGKVPVTKENAGSISLLAKEFWLEDLLSQSSALQMDSTPELMASLSARISKLERQISSQLLALIAELKESIGCHERQLQSFRSRISGLEPNLRTELKELKLGSPAPISKPTPAPPVSASKSLKEAWFPLTEAKSPDGIISLANTGQMFTIKELLQLLRGWLFMMITSILFEMPLISLLTRFSSQRMSQVSGFAGISTKCVSARLITES